MKLNKNNPNYASSYSATSWGDPHDSVTKTNGRGVTTTKAWDDTSGTGKTLSRINGGTKGSQMKVTTTEAPWENGVAINDSATIQTGRNPKSAVTVNLDGSVTVGNKTRTLEDGQSFTMRNGTNVSQSGTTTTVTTKKGNASTAVTAVPEGYLNIGITATDSLVKGYLNT